MIGFHLRPIAVIDNERFRCTLRIEIHSMTSQVLTQLHLNPDIVQTLSPELRDQLLRFVKDLGRARRPS